MQNFWFQPESPTNLGICRLLWFGVVFLLYCSTDFSAWGTVDSVFWHPINTFAVLGLPALAEQAVAVLQVVWKVSLLACCVGVLTRVNTVVACVLGFYLLGLPNNFGKVHHADAVVVLTMFILAFSRCGDAVSFDSLIRRARVAPSGEYRWPVRAVWMLISFIFLAAGSAKLRLSGLEWMNGENLSILLIRNEPLAWTGWGLGIAQHHWLCVGLSVATVGIECSFFFALFHPYCRAILVPCGLAMLIGFPLFIGAFFPQLIATFVFWIRWDAIVARWLPHWAEQPTTVVPV
jgi:hypothetical protein